MQPNILEILQSTGNIAVVGCSGDPGKDAHKIPAFLQECGYNIIPVNPNHNRVLDEPCYPVVSSIPDNIPVDVVDIFRPSGETAGIVRQIIDWSHQTNRLPVIWTQLGVSSEEAEELAGEAGFAYIPNRCMKVEYERYSSEIPG